MSATKIPEPVVARDRILEILRGEPDGLSRNELFRRAGINRGAFRRLIAALRDTGKVTVTKEYRPNGGETAVHRIAE